MKAEFIESPHQFIDRLICVIKSLGATPVGWSRVWIIKMRGKASYPEPLRGDAISTKKYLILSVKQRGNLSCSTVNLQTELCNV